MDEAVPANMAAINSTMPILSMLRAIRMPLGQRYMKTKPHLIFPISEFKYLGNVDALKDDGKGDLQ